MDFPVLSVILLTPLAAALLLCFLNRESRSAIRIVAAAAMAFSFALSVWAYFGYDLAAGGMQYTERVPWITDLGVSYALGVDGISLPLLLLTELIGVSAVFST